MSAGFWCAQSTYVCKKQFIVPTQAQPVTVQAGTVVECHRLDGESVVLRLQRSILITISQAFSNYFIPARST